MKSAGPLPKALAYFGLVFGAGFILGLIRVPFLVPRVGERMAELIEMPVMFAVIWLASRYLVRSSRAPLPGREWAGIGLLALVMLAGVELVLASVMTGRTPVEYIATRDPVSGSVYLAMLVLYAAMPLVQSQLLNRGAG